MQPHDTPKSSAELYAAYWQSFDAFIAHAGDPWMHYVRRADYWTSFQLDRPGIHLAAVICIPPRRPEHAMRVELSLIKKTLGPDADYLFSLLQNWRKGLEATVGTDLEFNSHTPNQHQVAKMLGDCNPRDISDWPRQHDITLDWLRRFNDAFGARAASTA